MKIRDMINNEHLQMSGYFLGPDSELEIVVHPNLWSKDKKTKYPEGFTIQSIGADGDIEAFDQITREELVDLSESIINFLKILDKNITNE